MVVMGFMRSFWSGLEGRLENRTECQERYTRGAKSPVLGSRKGQGDPRLKPWATSLGLPRGKKTLKYVCRFFHLAARTERAVKLTYKQNSVWSRSALVGEGDVDGVAFYYAVAGWWR